MTCGADFIGSHLVDRLQVEGPEVVAFDNFDPVFAHVAKQANIAANLRHPRFQPLEVGVRYSATADLGASSRPEGIAHLTERAGVRPSIEGPTDDPEDYVAATAWRSEAVLRIEPGLWFIRASASGVQGKRPDAPSRESERSSGRSSHYVATERAR